MHAVQGFSHIKGEDISAYKHMSYVKYGRQCHSMLGHQEIMSSKRRKVVLA